MTVIDADAFFGGVDPLRFDESDPDSALVYFGVDDPTTGRRLWLLVLLMAVRDRAHEVNYLAYSPDRVLSYVVGGTQYELVPPPDTIAATLIEALRDLATPGRLARWRWRLAGFFSDRSAASLVALHAGGNRSHWAVTVWEAEGRRGAHFRRLDAVSAPPPVVYDPADSTTQAGSGI